MSLTDKILRPFMGCSYLICSSGKTLKPTKSRNFDKTSGRLMSVGLGLVLSLSISGCSQTGTSLADLQTSLASGQSGKSAPRKTSAETTEVIEKARDLQGGGNKKIALQMLGEAYKKTPKDEELRRAYAIAALEAGNSRLAYRLTSPKHAPANSDPRQLSIRGAALSALGQHDEAQQAFVSALALKPADPTLLNNLGMAMALKGDAKKAESLLRRAAEVAQSNRARHNLALVLDLQGRGDEAKKISRTKPQPSAIQTGWNGTVKSSLGGPVLGKNK